MIVEFLASLALGIVDFMIGWLPEADALALPDFAPLLGVFLTLDDATAGVLSETLTVASVLLSIVLGLFLFAVLRQLFSHAPFIGGR